MAVVFLFLVIAGGIYLWVNVSPGMGASTIIGGLIQSTLFFGLAEALDHLVVIRRRLPEPTEAPQAITTSDR